MRSLTVAILLCSLCPSLLAQKPTDASGKPAATASSPAADKWKALGEEHGKRMRAAGRDRTAAAEARKTRADELAAFVTEFPKASETAKANLELAQIAAMDKDNDGGKRALAAIDVAHLDLQSTLRAAMLAQQLEAAGDKKRLLDAAGTKARTIDERFEIVGALKSGMKDVEAADKLLADIEASAKTDDDKASVLMAKATMTRRAAGRDNREAAKEAYAAALAELAKTYPNTTVGKLAVSKIAASKLAPGSDPVPFTVKDMDGKDVSPADYKGKVLLVDFWATWCGPCMQELPNVLEAYKQYHDQGFEILGISLDRDTDKQKLLDTIKERGMSWRHVYDGKYWTAEVAVLHDVQSIPFTILYGRDGKVVDTNLRGEKLGEAVKAALEAK
jgi:thiol-disulfide isomerase/thioredoxin